MNLKKNHSLAELNTLGFDQKAQWYCEPACIEELRDALAFAREKSLSVFVLGGGSNIVLTDDVPGLTIKLVSNTVRYVETEGHIQVRAEAGTNWHTLVVNSLERGYSGLENLALIPGNVGAAPIQNIGAYGVELSDRVAFVEIIETQTGELTTLSAAECEFAYRDSIFKHRLKNSAIVVAVTLNLTDDISVNTEYDALAKELSLRNYSDPTPIQVKDTVIAIRESKLPDPNTLGNAGSFFKNPVISKQQFNDLQSQFSELPGFENNQQVKVPAAWLIDYCGWKGYRRNGVGVYKNQPLVLVHYGQSNGRELMKLAGEIRESVKLRFNIDLEQEPVLTPKVTLDTRST